MEAQFLVFENYIAGDLSPAALKEFELRLEKDVSFSREFYNYKETHTFLEHKFKNAIEQEGFKQNLAEISKKHFKQNKTTKNKFWYLGAVASIALLISVFLMKPTTPTYKEFVTYPEVNFTQRGAQDDILNDAESEFNKKDFTKATQLFSELLISEPKNNEFKLYKGFSLVELNRFNEADKILEELSKGSSSYKTQAIWYLALSKLKQKEYNASKELLKKIPQDAMYYRKAQQLISKLSD